MELPLRNATVLPCITCSTCDVQVPIHLTAEHVCSRAPPHTTGEGFERTPTTDTAKIAALESTVLKPRPFVPRIQPSATKGTVVDGESRPASSRTSSASASPVGRGLNTKPTSFHSSRKVSGPAIRRPPSPELLSQDCAFPPFPTNKANKRDASQHNSRRGRTRTPDGSSSRVFGHERMRSASVGVQRPKSRRGTEDDSRPSTASSSRQLSFGSGAGSRQASVDVLPLMPASQSTLSNASSDSSSDRKYGAENSTGPLPADVPRDPDTFAIQAIPPPELKTFNHHESISRTNMLPAQTSQADSEHLQGGESFEVRPDEPAYRAKRPPPITNLPSPMLDASSLRSQPSQHLYPPPTSPSTISRTITSLFSRKRNPSTSSKKSNPKTPATDGPRFIALSPDPDPQGDPLTNSSPRSSTNTDFVTSPQVHGTVQEDTGFTMDITETEYQSPQSWPPHISMSEDTREDNQNDIHNSQRDTFQMEKDMEDRLAVMTGVPRLSIVVEQAEDTRRDSVDSASSYGSVGFSYSSRSSRSTHVFAGHSTGSSISTARTMSTNEDALTSPFAKAHNTDIVFDSPTDPYLHYGRLAPVPELLSPEAEKSDPVTQGSSGVFTSPEDELDGFEFPVPFRQRRPSTPGSCRGICRGCSLPILSGEKSVSSKDGRLTGKYHKECFVCMTCKEAFATADFYVHDDQPYCSHHYHVLNKTLCESCGKGIEGHYLETSNVSGHISKKFHPGCLSCGMCKAQLNEDYFELGGKVYCERDAFKVINGPRSPYDTAPSRPSPLNREYVSSVEPGQGLAAGKFPERRLTKLMTTH